MALFPVAGCKFWVSTNPVVEKDVDLVASDFTAVTWIEVKAWTQMGSYGDTAQLITTDLIGEGRTKKQKGTKNAGTMQNVFALANTDAGQLKCIAAAGSIANYGWKVELNDKIATLNSTRLFHGLCMSAQEAGGGANTVQTLNVTVEINSNIVTTVAT